MRQFYVGQRVQLSASGRENLNGKRLFDVVSQDTENYVWVIREGNRAGQAYAKEFWEPVEAGLSGESRQ